MSTRPDFDDSAAFDQQLRAAFDDTGTPPPPPPLGVWAGLQPHLMPPAIIAPARPWQPALRGGAVGALLMALLMWNWLGTVAVRTPPIGIRLGTSDVQRPSSELLSGTPDLRTPSSELLSGTPDVQRPSSELLSGTPDVRTAAVAAVGAVPVRVAALLPGGTERLNSAVPLVLAALVLSEQTYAAVLADTARPFRERRRAALLVQRAELARLRWRTDSLLLGLGEAPPPALAATDSLPPSHPPTLPPSRWSVALTFAPERNFFGLSAPVTDTLTALRRTHETGRAGYNAALLAEYRLNDRLSVGAGLGLASYGAELRLTEHRTTVSTKLDSTIRHATNTNSVTTRAFSVRTVPDSVLSPTVNFNNQIIGYHYEPTTRRDTVWTNLTNTDVIHNTVRTYTPTVTTRDETTARLLKPNYRFLTVPVLMRYRLGRATDWAAPGTAGPRWWADVTLGAQLQFFLGGTQASTRDGVTYRTERVGPRGGPFRPLSVALTGSLGLNYALTPRLSASFAPTLRYQAESVYKASTSLTQKPVATGVQVGLRLAF